MCPGLSVRKVVRDVELPLGAFAHQLKSLGPTLDDLVDSEFGRHTPLVGTVEDLTVDETAFVVAPDSVGFAGHLVATLLDDFVLQAARKHYDTFFLCIPGKEGFTFLLHCLSQFGCLGGLSGLNVLEEVVENLACLFEIEGRHLTGKASLDGGSEIFDIEFCDA